VLRDGVTIRVGMMMRDERSAGRSHGLVHTGNDGHSPGHVYSTDGATRDASERARAEAIAEMCDAWRPTPRGVTADARRQNPGDDEIYDARLASPGGAVLDAQAAQAIRDTAYREYCARLQDEWRGGRASTPLDKRSGAQP
jgi:hypothetical protein